MYFSVPSNFRISLEPIWSNLTFTSHSGLIRDGLLYIEYMIYIKSTLTAQLIWQNNGLYHDVSTKSVLCLSHYSCTILYLMCLLVSMSFWAQNTHSPSQCSCVMSSPVLPPTVQPRTLHSFFKSNLNKAQRRCPKPKPKTTLCNLLQLTICSRDGYVMLEQWKVWHTWLFQIHSITILIHL